jgi:hypothetical protein
MDPEIDWDLPGSGTGLMRSGSGKWIRICIDLELD